MPFVKGQSGNPGGRPKGPTLTDALRSILRQKQPDGTTNRTAIARKLVEQALEGNLDATRLIFDRVDGKPAEPMPSPVAPLLGVAFTLRIDRGDSDALISDAADADPVYPSATLPAPGSSTLQ